MNADNRPIISLECRHRFFCFCFYLLNIIIFFLHSPKNATLKRELNHQFHLLFARAKIIIICVARYLLKCLSQWKRANSQQNDIHWFSWNYSFIVHKLWYVLIKYNIIRLIQLIKRARSSSSFWPMANSIPLIALFIES